MDDDSWLWGDNGQEQPMAGGGRIKEVRAKVIDDFGKDQGRRLDKAGDLTNLERFNDKALYDIFKPDANAKLGVINPGKFEDYAAPLGAATTRSPYDMRTDGTRWPSFDAYVRHLSYIGKHNGFDEVPQLYLDVLRPKTPWHTEAMKQGSVAPIVDAHEGRHRMRALEYLQDPSALVQFLMMPRATGVVRGSEPVIPEGRVSTPATQRPLLPELFAGGGRTDKPKTFKVAGKEHEALPLKPAEDAAANYMRFIGRTHQPLVDYPDFNAERARKIGEAYEAMQHAPTDPRVKRAYDAMIEETLGQYKHLKDAGYDFQFIKPGEGDPYAQSPALGYLDLRDRGRLAVFPTDAGFGTLGELDVASNPLLRRVGKIGDLDNATANDAFRIVHDMFGHFGPGNPFFRHKGEERAWLHHKDMYSPEAIPAMTSETRGQNSWLNFGPYGERNRNASSADTVYADQKSGLMPDWTWHDYKKGGRVEFRDDFDTMFGGQSRKAGDLVRRHTEKTGKEGASLGNEFFHTPLIRGEQMSVNLDNSKLPFSSFSSDMERQGMPYFSVHSHPVVTAGPKFLRPKEGANIMSAPYPALGGPFFPSGPDLLHTRPNHSMLIESGGLPENRLMVPGARMEEYADARRLLGTLRQEKWTPEITSRMHDWNKANNLWWGDDLPLDLLVNDALAKRGVPIAIDARASSGRLGGAEPTLASDILPDFKKYLERRNAYPFAEGGYV